MKRSGFRTSGRSPSGPWGPDHGDSGGAAPWVARILGNPDNPLGWSIALFRIAGVSVRMHLFTALFVGVMLVWSILPSQMGLRFMALAMAALVIVVLFHELGHVVACRSVKGAAERVVLLPFGGLALTLPPDSWRAHFATAAGGPLVNLLSLPLTSGALWASGLGDHIWFNPLAPSLTLASPAFQASTNLLATLKVGLWWLHYTNLALLAFNVLLPAFPFDGGRMLQAMLWPRIGYRRSVELTVNIGFVTMALLGAFALVANSSLLLAVAAIGAWSCWLERRRVRGEIELGALGYGASPDRDAPDSPDTDAAAKLREAHEQEDVDRILAKIAASGMASLTRRERRTLDEASRRRRHG